MQPHTKLAESQRAQELLRTIDARESLRRHLQAISNATRKARRRRLVGDREPPRRGQLANFLLRETTVSQRAANIVLIRRSHSRAVISQVVGIRTVYDDVHAKPLF